MSRRITVAYPDGSKQTFTSIAALADACGDLKQSRLAAQREVDAIKERETALSEWLIDNLPKMEATATAGAAWQATIKEKTVPQVQDWDALYEHVINTRRFEFLQRRLGDAAVKEQWEAGAEVPGVERIDIKTLSLTKVVK